MDKGIKSHLEDTYETGAKEYEGYIKNSFSWKYIEEPALGGVLKDTPLGLIKILDAGCGNGRVIKYLLSHGAKEENIIGVDYSAELIGSAKEKFPKVHFICADMSDRDLKIDKVDLVTSSMSLPYLDNDQFRGALANFHSWLSKDGLLVYLVLHPIRLVRDDSKDYFLRDLKDIKSPWGPTVKHFHRTVSDYINFTIEAGFRIEAVDEPEVLEEGKKYPEDYIKYIAGPSRLIIKARRV